MALDCQGSKICSRMWNAAFQGRFGTAVAWEVAQGNDARTSALQEEEEEDLALSRIACGSSCTQ